MRQSARGCVRLERAGRAWTRRGSRKAHLIERVQAIPRCLTHPDVRCVRLVEMVVGPTDHAPATFLRTTLHAAKRQGRRTQGMSVRASNRATCGCVPSFSPSSSPRPTLCACMTKNCFYPRVPGAIAVHLRDNIVRKVWLQG